MYLTYKVMRGFACFNTSMNKKLVKRVTCAKWAIVHKFE